MAAHYEGRVKRYTCAIRWISYSSFHVSHASPSGNGDGLGESDLGNGDYVGTVGEAGANLSKGGQLRHDLFESRNHEPFIS